MVFSDAISRKLEGVHVGFLRPKADNGSEGSAADGWDLAMCGSREGT